MQKTAVTVVALAAAGTAMAVAYGCMKPSAKQQLRQDIKSCLLYTSPSPRD